MTLIEGVGDEVTQFATVVLLLTVAALAWWSTNARPDRYRTVLVMRSRAIHPVTISIRTRPGSNSQITQNNPVHSPPHVQPSIETSSEEAAESATREPSVIPVQEMDSIVDADMAMMDHNRLHFYRRLDASPETVNETSSEDSEVLDDADPPSSAQIREMDSIVSAMEADIINECDFMSTSQDAASELTAESSNPKHEKPHDQEPTKRPTSDVAENHETAMENTDVMTQRETEGDNIDSSRDARNILIKLKYLNDSFKEVEGSLDELLKDFKWRHFANELSAEHRVRLIFNGRVLGDEAATLQALGLHHRAVVHCLVHPNRHSVQRSSVVSEEAPLSPPELVAEQPPQERSWDFENVLMTLVSIALTIVWFFRCEYSNMFTASASVALFGLTVFYSVAIFGLYLSDTFHTDRRPAGQTAPAPAPAPAHAHAN